MSSYCCVLIGDSRSVSFFCCWSDFVDLNDILLNCGLDRNQHPTSLATQDPGSHLAQPHFTHPLFWTRLILGRTAQRTCSSCPTTTSVGGQPMDDTNAQLGIGLTRNIVYPFMIWCIYPRFWLMFIANVYHTWIFKTP